MCRWSGGAGWLGSKRSSLITVRAITSFKLPADTLATTAFAAAAAAEALAAWRMEHT